MPVVGLCVVGPESVRMYLRRVMGDGLLHLHEKL